MTERRVAVTGIGVIAPRGIGTAAFWETLMAGRTATRRITHFDPADFRCQVAAEIDFDPLAVGLSPQEARRMDRAGQLALVAAREALADSGLTGSGLAGSALDPARVGVSLGNAIGCTELMEREYVVLSDGGRKWLVDPEYAVPHLYDVMVPSSMAAELAWSCGAEGPVALVSTGCTSGIDALGHAFELVREGSADVVLAAGTDAPVSPVTVACFDTLRAQSTANDDPEHACRPYDRNRKGLILGEGSAVMVFEELEHARRRGAHVYCEVVGYASRANGYHMTGLKPDGREMAEAIRVALDQARLNPDEIDYVNGHGSGTRQNDRHETAAFKSALGAHAYDVPVSSIKSMIGHSLGAIGAIEVAACCLAIEHDAVPPTANLETPDPECDLDYVPKVAREQRTDVVLSVGSGFGGFQSAIVLAGEGKARR
ncbi:beta-ketoacyl-[acyl-carrier-protein] synthase family protein [Kitasatospora aureofaciens]|uniref:beta-ketoacyl-[acyl-carrier-protein] synthase family protein n=1 Tax=Kitasatospora aureofaciens TaxID=1894 RepID=UPI001C43F418|nr:beta-ketoacyl-[acyl-carrier-protein] synthase family protein [Kitasatospora aureofaciens]MBV6696719.1 beta-ketoacyl-[acyl-carrier-protein] synthase family protein [Kitasatospora aureofaciens]